MNSNQPDETQAPITSEEQAILDAIRKNPALKGRFAKLLEDFNAEVSKGMDELEAETFITKTIRNIGADLVEDWATHSEKIAVENALKSDHVIKQGKKNASGIRLSE
jgi:hypothetical protein